MTKVCHLTSAHGVEDVRIFHKECVTLAKAGYDVYLVERGESYDKNGVHIVGVGDIPASRRKRMTEGVQKVYDAALEVDADIYHLHDPELLRIALKLKRLGKKVIFDSHENVAASIMEKQYISPIIRWAVYWAYDKYENYVCNRLDTVVYVTPGQDIAEKVKSKRIMITNYPMLNYEVSGNSCGEKGKTLVFAGGISEQWNHHVVVDVLADIDDATYTLCGLVGASYLKKLEVLPGWKRVKYLGKVSFAEVSDILKESSVGLAILSKGRNTKGNMGTLGNTKIFEEMMAGLPVICTNFSLWKNIIDKYHCGICVDPTNKDEVKSAIEYLFAHPDEAKQMGLNGRKAVEQEFNWDTQAVKLLELYRELGVR